MYIYVIMKKLIVLSVLCLLCSSVVCRAVGNYPLDSLKTDSEGFYILFDGSSFNGWRGFGKDSVPSVWTISDGCLEYEKTPDCTKGDIIFDHEFGDFELKFEWMVTPNANSGVFIHAREVRLRDGSLCPIYMTAPEYQIRDNDIPAASVLQGHQSGSLYDMIPADPQNANEVGEWNTGAIRVRHGRVSFFQNGVRVVKFNLRSKSWIKMLEDSKFSSEKSPEAYEILSKCGKRGYAGYIGIQDHGRKVYFRNIRVKPL